MPSFFSLMPLSLAHTGFPPVNLASRPVGSRVNTNQHKAIYAARIATLKGILSSGRTSRAFTLMVSPAPFQPISISMKALSTLIMATVVTKIGRLKMEAREELMKPNTTATPTQTRNMTRRFPVAL